MYYFNLIVFFFLIIYLNNLMNIFNSNFHAGELVYF